MRPTLPATLRADCSACVGLCCVIPPFDALQGFGFDKPAETPCRHLCADHRCGIHERLLPEGFAGCVAFDCLGAGQRLTALARERFGSAVDDWRERPELARWLFTAYPGVRRLQEALATLRLAAGLPGAPAAFTQLADELEAGAAGWPALDAAAVEAWRGRVAQTLALHRQAGMNRP